ncbi:type VII toxin-antitoxin system HepT family RNase toxin [Methanolobus psychrotolerans]|uniref:type VII toxin-antitoxin system HepT family RNase toxin n=1 Tax=Methanolobus psychrotolerans TaxID=1874706 RepID=UPI000B915C08|nr:DUF86 domain-containing protein [Methanolobus psychrotolerans]
MHDNEKILRKLNFMQRCVSYLKSVDASSAGLEDNYELRSAVERNFQLAIESAIDIGEIIISREGLERPEVYRSVFLILGKNGIIPANFAEDFAQAAGFRNVLVHMYEGIDVDILHMFLTERLEDFDEFARYIVEYLSRAS